MVRPNVFRDRFSCDQSLALVPALGQGVGRQTLVSLCQNTMFSVLIHSLPSWKCFGVSVYRGFIVPSLMVFVYLLTNVGLNRLKVAIPEIMCQTRLAMCFVRVFSPDGRSGVVPKELGNTTTLTRLDISGNKLTSKP